MLQTFIGDCFPFPTARLLLEVFVEQSRKRGRLPPGSTADWVAWHGPSSWALFSEAGGERWIAEKRQFERVIWEGKNSQAKERGGEKSHNFRRKRYNGVSTKSPVFYLREVWQLRFWGLCEWGQQTCLVVVVMLALLSFLFIWLLLQSVIWQIMLCISKLFIDYLQKLLEWFSHLKEPILF